MSAVRWRAGAVVTPADHDHNYVGPHGRVTASVCRQCGVLSSGVTTDAQRDAILEAQRRMDLERVTSGLRAAVTLEGYALDDDTVTGMIDDVVEGYLTAQLWTASHTLEGNDGNADIESLLDAGMTTDQLEPDYVERVRGEVEQFVSEHCLAYRMMTAHYARTSRGAQWSPAELFGHDLLLTRDGHGAGFWDRGAGAVGDYLTDACSAMGESAYLSLSDDDVIPAVWDVYGNEVTPARIADSATVHAS